MKGGERSLVAFLLVSVARARTLAQDSMGVPRSEGARYRKQIATDPMTRGLRDARLIQRFFQRLESTCERGIAALACISNRDFVAPGGPDGGI